MTIPQAFADIALGFSAVTGSSFHEGVARWPGTPVMQGGSIVSPGVPQEHDCHVQVDQVTEAMRQSEGYRDKDMWLLVLVATLDRELDASAKVAVTAGPYAGTEWMLATVSRDPAGIYFECRGRKA